MAKQENDTEPRIADRTANELPDPSGEWRDDSVLRDLYVRRGWSATNIATYFDTDPDTVENYIDWCDELGRGTDTPANQPPTHGLAAEIWRQGIVEKREAAHGE